MFLKGYIATPSVILARRNLTSLDGTVQTVFTTNAIDDPPLDKQETMIGLLSVNCGFSMRVLEASDAASPILERADA
jgi:hypothetical protein